MKVISSRGVCLGIGMLSVASLASACGGGGGPSGDPDQGRVVSTRLQCASCHGNDYAGLDGPGLGPNLTPHEETGLGSWSDDEIRRAIRQGMDNEGETLCIAMARYNTASLSNNDLDDLIAYLRSLPGVDKDHTDECE